MGGDSRGKQRESRAAAAGCGSAGSCQALMQRISHERLGLGWGSDPSVLGAIICYVGLELGEKR